MRTAAVSSMPVASILANGFNDSRQVLSNALQSRRLAGRTSCLSAGLRLRLWYSVVIDAVANRASSLHIVNCSTAECCASLVQARILQSIDADGILPYFTYSDSSQVTLGGHEFHPIVLYLACGRVHEARKESAFRRIAFLFKPTAECLGLSKTSKADTAR